MNLNRVNDAKLRYNQKQIFELERPECAKFSSYHWYAIETYSFEHVDLVYLVKASFSCKEMGSEILRVQVRAPPIQYEKNENYITNLSWSVHDACCKL